MRFAPRYLRWRWVLITGDGSFSGANVEATMLGVWAGREVGQRESDVLVWPMGVVVRGVFR